MRLRRCKHTKNVSSAESGRRSKLVACGGMPLSPKIFKSRVYESAISCFLVLIFSSENPRVEQLQVPMSVSSKGGFPLSRNFYVRTDVNLNWLDVRKLK